MFIGIYPPSFRCSGSQSCRGLQAGRIFHPVTYSDRTLSVGVEVATTIAGTLIYLILASNSMQKVNMIRDDFNYFYRKTVAIADLLLWGLFLSSRSIFSASKMLFLIGEGIIHQGIKVGAVEITLGNILIFIVVIWFQLPSQG